MTQGTLIHTALTDINSDQYTFSPKWKERYESLIHFKKENNHCRVPSIYKQNPQLGKWVETQRTQKDKLPAVKVKLLNEIGFDWNPFETIWNEMYQTLTEFKLKHNHCKVPTTPYKANSRLGRWVDAQRKSKDKLPTERIKKLNDIGFDWVKKKSWNELYEELVQFKSDNNHCRVPATYKKNPDLSSWVSKQKMHRIRLPIHKINKLNALDFEWTKTWDEMYEELIQFKTENNQCRVSQSSTEPSQLGNWVRTQRFQKNKLTADKIKKLNDISFDWNPRETVWNEMYEVLVQFKLKNNHCMVPQSYKENAQLGDWVRTQRKSKNKLPEHKLDKLNALEFDWRLR